MENYYGNNVRPNIKQANIKEETIEPEVVVTPSPTKETKEVSEPVITEPESSIKPKPIKKSFLDIFLEKLEKLMVEY